MKLFKPSAFALATDKDKVGTYPAFSKSGGGYFYDDVLEYRVWVHPKNEEAKFCAFATYDEAMRFSRKTPNAEKPLVLIRQNEWVDEPESGKFIHVKQPRTAEWQVEWLKGNKGSRQQIPKFLASHSSDKYNLLFHKYADTLKSVPFVESNLTDNKDEAEWTFKSATPGSLEVKLSYSKYGPLGIFLNVQGTDCAYWNTIEETDLDYHIKLAVAALNGDVRYNRSTLIGREEICFQIDNIWHCTRTDKKDHGFHYITKRKKLKRPRK
jgi:hypothetical protein